MPVKVQHRDISPILQKVRNFLLGRNHITALRFEDCISSRSPEQPNIPNGPCHGIKENFYCDRDVRREVKPPVIIASDKAAIAAKAEGQSLNKLPLPGKVYRWD